MPGHPRLIYWGVVQATAVLGLAFAVWLPVALWPWLLLVALAIVGHLRYMLEFIRPELRQYFFEPETSGPPFSREQPHTIYARSATVGDTAPFGTMRDFEDAGFNFAQHSMAPKDVDVRHRRLRIGVSPTIHRDCISRRCAWARCRAMRLRP